MVKHVEILERLAGNLSSQLEEDSAPLHLFWCGMTVSEILEELYSLIDTAIESHQENIVLMTDETIEKIIEASFECREPTTETGDDYGLID